MAQRSNGVFKSAISDEDFDLAFAKMDHLKQQVSSLHKNLTIYIATTESKLQLKYHFRIKPH